MAADLKAKTGHEARLIEGSRGIFDVRIDGKLVFSKYESGRFPTLKDIVQ
ncbi:MAG: Rdx family protein [Candidatus Sericytochromatia bacterium]|nr:Rdx family protein [Candidatus Tanganyikabacteria bacterium]